MLFSTVEDRILPSNLPNLNSQFEFLFDILFYTVGFLPYDSITLAFARVFDSCSEAKTRNPLSQAENSVNFFEF